MIRFCDREVCCVEYDSLNRMELLNYFVSGHEEDVLYIYDDCNMTTYRGRLTFHSLRASINIDSAIREEYVILNSDIWENVRRYFVQRMGNTEIDLLLPVLNEEYQLICFAYEDTDANREIRMLRELMEMSEALQFSDVYPGYKCVKIYEFNELAYFFARYLEKQNITVQVDGAMWQGFFAGEECSVPDYMCLTIHAEGIGDKKRNWRENLLGSVSVEFECIDKIYETNIENGKFKNAKGDCNFLIERLKGEKNIVILGTGCEAQDTYDFLMAKGIDVRCFMEKWITPAHQLFGKDILSIYDVRNRYENPIFIECEHRNSAWGFGGTDYFDYIGHRRNENFFLIRDYVEIPGNCLLNVLKEVKVVLTGDPFLCGYLFSRLEKSGISVNGYLDAAQDTRLKEVDLPVIPVESIDEETICLIAYPQYFEAKPCRLKSEARGKILKYLREHGIQNYTDYFSYTTSFIDFEDNGKKYFNRELIPKRVVLGSILGWSGNVFFRGMMDSHPQILMLDYSFLNSNLFWICTILSIEEAENILSKFWPLYNSFYEFCYDEVESDSPRFCFVNADAFNDKMSQLLQLNDHFTSQELFVMIHIAFMYMYGYDIPDIGNVIIYFEPHMVWRHIMEKYVRWLGIEEMPCDIINVVRNTFMRIGSEIKAYIKGGCESDSSRIVYDVYKGVFTRLDPNKRITGQYDRLGVKFEDLKCNPRETLENICERWGIEWSDTFMHVTWHGKKILFNNGEYVVSDFDLRPVYNTYEEYFSEFDRFRLAIFHGSWQRKYGYPYVEITQFSRREILEIMSKRFRFEDMVKFADEKAELDYKVWLQNEIREALQEVRMQELLEKKMLKES